MLASMEQPVRVPNEQIELRYLNKVTSSITETISLLEFINGEGQENVKHLTEKVRGLEVEDKARNEKRAQFNALDQLVSSLRSRVDNLKKGTSGLVDTVGRRDQLIDVKLAEVEQSLQEQKRKNGLMLDSIRWFEKCLGFRVEPTKNNGLRIILTNVLSDDLDREFCFSIRHDKQTNQYTMLECNPDLLGKMELINELNRSNDFKKFIFNMRNVFRTEYSHQESDTSHIN